MFNKLQVRGKNVDRDLGFTNLLGKVSNLRYKQKLGPRESGTTLTSCYWLHLYGNINKI